MEKVRHILNRVLFLLFVLLFGGNAFGQITLSLRFSSTDNKYHVYLKPTATLSAVTNPRLTDGSSQITLMASTGNLAIGTVTSVSPAGSWDLSTTTRNNGDVGSGAPAGKDFFVITPSGDFTSINYTSGTEVELFNFDVTGTCTGSLDILSSAGQTAAGGTLNIGSYYSVKGYPGGIGTNHFASTYDLNAACPVPVVLTPDLTTSIGQPTTPLTVGQSSNIPVTITNVGTAPATGPIATTITLPTGTSAPASFTSGTSTCSTSGQTVTCSTPGSLSNVSPSNTAVINVPVTPAASTAGTSPVFTGTTSSPDEPAGNAGNNAANPMTPSTPVAGVPDVVTSIGQPTTPLTVGQASNIPVTISNIGSGPATGPIITTITIPTGTSAPASFTSGTSTCSTSGQTVTCSTPGPLSNVSPSNTAVINVPVTPSASTAGTTPTFTATTSAPNEPAGSTGNNAATPMTPTTAVAGVPDLVTSIGQPTTPLTVGQASNIPVTITNIGSGPATGPIVTTIAIPTGTSAPASFTSGTSTCSTSGQTVTCSTPGLLSNVSPNNTAVINVPVTPSASTAGTTPTFTATTSAPNEPAGNAGNNAATPMTPTTAVAGVPDLVTSIGQPTTPLTVGQASNIPVTITNIGSGPATGPIVTTIAIPTGTSAPASFTSGTSTCSTSGQTVTCSTPGPLSNVSPSNTAVINVPVTPSASIAGTTPTFTATTSAPNEPAGNTGNNAATPMTPSSVSGVPDLVTSIGQPTTPLTVGQASNIPVTITNIGSGPATGPIATTITIPTGTSAPASFTSGTSTCSTSGQTVTCSTPGPLSNVSPSNTAVINVPVTPSASTAGTTPTFTATTSSPDEPAGNTGNNAATPVTPTTPIAGVPDLVTSIGQPTTPLTVGQASSIPVTVTNIGTGPATGPITTTFTLPTGTSAPASFTSGTSTCTTSGQTVTCSTPGPLSNVSPNNTAVINVPVTPSASSAGTTPTFTATTAAPNEPAGSTGNNAATPMTPSSVAGVPDLVTSIGQPTTPLTVGQSSDIPVTITNIGTGPATGPISTTITLPTGTSAPASFTSGLSTCTTSGQTVTCSTPGPLSNVSPNNTAVINVPVTPSASAVGTTPSFTATTTAPNEPAGSTGNNTAPTMTPTSPIAGVPDLVTSIGQPTTPLTVGQASNIPVTITNIGTGPATSPITTTITLPTGTSAPASFTSGTSTCIAVSQTVTCSTPGLLSNVSPNNTAVINVPVTPSASAAGTTPTFTATTSAPNEPAGSTGNNAAPTMTPTSPIAGVPDLVTSIGQPTTPLTVGQSSNIPVTITNIGTGPATGPITITITLPTGTSAPASFTSGTSSCTTSGQTVTCSTPGPLSNVSPNNTAVINVPVTPSASSAGTTPTFTATTTAPNEPAGNTGNNAAPTMTPTSPIAGVPDLVTSIGQPTTPLTVGQASNIPVTITNIGTGPATGPITTTFTLPTGTSAPASFTSGTSTCSTSGQTVTCSTPGPLSNVSPNNTAVINVPVTPSASSAGTTPTFTATTTAPNEPAGSTGNNAAPTMTPTSPIAGVPDLVTSIGQPTTPLTVGQASNVPVTITNIGTGPATGPITTTFTLPTGTSAPASFTSGTSTCTTSGQTVTCSTPGPLSNVSPNNTAVINVPVTPSASTAGTTPSFTATTTAPNEPAGNTGNNVSPTMTPTNPVQNTTVPDLALSFGTPTPALTENVSSTIPITITNVGTASVNGQLVVTFNIPNNTTSPLSYNAGNGWICNASGAILLCANANATGLAPAAATTLNIQLTPNANTVGQSVILNATVTAVAGETALTNNTSVVLVPTPISSSSLKVSIKAFLQGAAANGTGVLMRDDLRVKGLIPASQPYTTTNGYTQVNNSGSETVASTVLSATGNDAIVDWVMVELRSSTNPATVVATRSALIQRDGDIVDVNGTSAVSFGSLAAGNYYISVRHRNHLSVMTANTVAVSGTTPVVDFTSTSLANYSYPVGNLKRNTSPQVTDSGKNMLWAGNAYRDDKVIFQGPDNDVDAIFFSIMTDGTNTNSFTNFIRNNVYDNSDVDMNGQVIFQGPNNEVDLIFFEVLTHSSNTSQFLNYIIWQQLP